MRISYCVLRVSLLMSCCHWLSGKSLTGVLDGYIVETDGRPAKHIFVSANCGEKQISGDTVLPIYIPKTLAGVLVWSDGPTNVPKTHRTAVTDSAGFYSIKLPATPPLSSALTPDKSCIVFAGDNKSLNVWRAMARWITIPPNGATHQNLRLIRQGLVDFRDQGPLGRSSELSTSNPAPSMPPARESPSSEADRMRVAPVWVDPTTGLMWASESSKEGMTWVAAVEFCKNSKLDGYSNWRLPEISELAGLYDKLAQNSQKIRGRIDVKCCPWSATLWGTMRTGSRAAYFFMFGTSPLIGGKPLSAEVTIDSNEALCVRNK